MPGLARLAVRILPQPAPLCLMARGRGLSLLLSHQTLPWIPGGTFMRPHRVSKPEKAPYPHAQDTLVLSNCPVGLLSPNHSTWVWRTRHIPAASRRHTTTLDNGYWHLLGEPSLPP